MHAGLEIVGDPEAVLEADDRPVVEREQILGQRAEVAAPQIAREPMGQTEIALMPVQRPGRRQIDQVELDLGRRRRRAAASGVCAATGGAGRRRASARSTEGPRRGRDRVTETWRLRARRKRRAPSGPVARPCVYSSMNKEPPSYRRSAYRFGKSYGSCNVSQMPDAPELSIPSPCRPTARLSPGPSSREDGAGSAPRLDPRSDCSREVGDARPRLRSPRDRQELSILVGAVASSR